MYFAFQNLAYYSKAHYSYKLSRLDLFDDDSSKENVLYGLVYRQICWRDKVDKVKCMLPFLSEEAATDSSCFL